MKKQILTIAFGLLNLCMNAQTTALKTYEGPFQNGTAKYTYYENEKGERVYQGKFEYIEKGTNLSVKDIFGQTVKESASIKQVTGQYKNGKAFGERKRRLYLIASAGTIDLSKINPSNSQLVEEITYNYNEAGDFEGSYQYASYDIKTNKIDKKITASIKNDHLIGKYECVDYRFSPTYSLTGSFNNEGYFDGEWNFTNTDIKISTMEKLRLASNATLKEKRKYNNGLLLSVKIFDNAKGNLLYEYDDKIDFTSEKYPNVSRDSLKLSFNQSSYTKNKANADYKIGKDEYVKYKDYTNLHSTELLPMGMGFATEFEHIGGYVKVYTYKYNLNNEERLSYKKRYECYSFINNSDEVNKMNYSTEQTLRYKEIKLIDSVLQYMTKNFINQFDKKQQSIEGQFKNNRICYVFNDTLSFDPATFKEINAQIAANANIKDFFNNYYVASYRKLAEGNKIANSLIKAIRNMPPSYDVKKEYASEYSQKLDELNNNLRSDLFEIRKPLLNHIKQGNNNEFLNELDTVINKLKVLDNQYDESMIKLIQLCKFDQEWEEKCINKVKKSKLN